MNPIRAELQLVGAEASADIPAHSGDERWPATNWHESMHAAGRVYGRV